MISCLVFRGTASFAPAARRVFDPPNQRRQGSQDEKQQGIRSGV
jgi:hypothetical protein